MHSDFSLNKEVWWPVLTLVGAIACKVSHKSCLHVTLQERARIFLGSLLMTLLVGQHASDSLLCSLYFIFQILKYKTTGSTPDTAVETVARAQRHRRLDADKFPMFSVGCTPGKVFVVFWIPVGLSSGLSPWCDPLTFVHICDHDRDWRLIGLWQTCCVTVVSSVARTTRWMCESTIRLRVDAQKVY